VVHRDCRVRGHALPGELARQRRGDTSL